MRVGTNSFYQPLCYFDIENDASLATFLIGTLDAKGIYRSFLFRRGDDMSFLFKFINNKKLVAFNGAYDINHLVDISPIRFVHREVVVGSKMKEYYVRYHIEYKGKTYGFEVYDLRALFPCDLKTVATLFGLQKGDFFERYRDGISTEEFMAKLGELLNYNKQDLIITKTAYERRYDFFKKVCEDVIEHIFHTHFTFSLSRAYTISSVSFRLLLCYCAIYDVLYCNGQNAKEIIKLKRSKSFRACVRIDNDHIYVYHDMKKYVYVRIQEPLNDFFKGYYGGLVINEHIHVKKGVNSEYGVSFYDVNSLYPYAMAHLYIQPFVHADALPADVITDAHYYGVAKCVVHSCTLPLGLIVRLPKRPNRCHIWKDKPHEMFLAFPEIRLLMEYGNRVDIIEARGKKGVYPLDLFFNCMYNLRLSYRRMKSPFQIAIKLMMNSAYGRFGTRYETLETKYCFDTVEEFVLWAIHKFDRSDIDKLFLYGDLAMDENRLRFFKRDNHYWLAIYRYSEIIEDFYFASTITSQARVIMQRYAQKLKENGWRIFAVDTDSFKTDAPLEAVNSYGICDSAELGKLKYEGSSADFVSVRKKFYGYIDEKGATHIRAKGLSFFFSKKPDTVPECETIFYQLCEAVDKGLEYISIVQERKPSIENGRITEHFLKNLRCTPDGGIVDENKENENVST